MTRLQFMVLAMAVVAAGLLIFFVAKSRHAPTARPYAGDTVRKPGLDAGNRALWVWENTAVTNALARTELFGLCRQQKISSLLYFMGRFADHQYNTEYLAQLQAFVGRAHEEGMRVHALRAMPVEPELARRDRHYEAVTYLRDFLLYNHAQQEDRRFDGILIDLEPQLLPEWALNEEGIQEAFADLVLEFWKTIAEFDTGLPLGWSLPASFAGYPWLPRVLERLDYVLLSGGGDQTESLIRQSRNMLRAVATNEAHIVVNLEAREAQTLGREDASATFQDEGIGTLDTAAGAISEALHREPGFAGVAINDYRNLLRLAARRGAGETGAVIPGKEP